MPEMTGAELAKVVRKLLPDAKILFTTCYTRNAIVHNGVLRISYRRPIRSMIG